MRRTWTIVALLALAAGSAGAEPSRTESYKPAYVPPAELVQMLGAREGDGGATLAWSDGGAEHRVAIRRNDAANLLLFTGAADDVAAASAMAKAFDVAPRQIALEARIVEVDVDRAKDLGIDWSRVNLSAGLGQRITRQTLDRYHDEASMQQRSYDRSTSMSLDQNASLTLGNALTLLEQQGGATYRDAPRVLTLNNRAATVFDGTHVTYVNRAVGYANVYQSEAMDAGLKLDVVPSLVESGYLRLQLHAELTSFLPAASAVPSGAGSPAKTGQTVDDVVMAKDGETVLLGGFTRTVEARAHKRFPVLGSILPFVFSRETQESHRRTTLIAITPRVVDLAAGADEPSRGMLEGR